MNLKPNQHKIISFNTTTMTSLGFIDPPKILGPPLNLAPPKFNFLLRSPQLFWSEIFRSLPKIAGGGAATIMKFVDFTKTQKSRYLEKKTLFFLQIKKSLITHQGLFYGKK